MPILSILIVGFIVLLVGLLASLYLTLKNASLIKILNQNIAILQYQGNLHKESSPARGASPALTKPPEKQVTTVAAKQESIPEDILLVILIAAAKVVLDDAEKVIRFRVDEFELFSSWMWSGKFDHVTSHRIK